MSATDCPTLSPRAIQELRGPSPWRAAAIVCGGQWLAAIHDQTFRVYYIGAPPRPGRSLVQPPILVEQTFDLRHDSELSLFWDSSTQFGHVLQITELEGPSSTGHRLWFIHIIVSEFLGVTELKIELLGVLNVAGASRTCIHGVSQPVLHLSDDRDSAILWTKEETTTLQPLAFPSDIMFYNGLGGFLATYTNGGYGLNVWQIPDRPPRSGEPLNLINLSTFDWTDQIITSGYVSNLWQSSTILEPVPASGTGDLVATFVVVVQYQDEVDGDGVFSGRRIEFIRKKLVIHHEDGIVAGCNLIDERRDDLRRIPMHRAPEASSLDSSGGSSFTWFIDHLSPSHTPGEPWRLAVHASRVDGLEKERTAFLGFGEVDEKDMHPERMDLCLLSGRGVNHAKHSLFVFDWGLDASSHSCT
ncbi:hypothetical protein DL96DRAFT_1560948 [Flagelloscypha sp. PMI_526]|nr:hypothetical protein DL96DRAFT_1560948 [Flagelloscypha sp. PMI_526]